MLDRASWGSRARVVELIREILDKKPVVRSVPIGDELSGMGLGSMDMINLMLAVEAEFDIAIPQAELTIENFRSVSTIELLIDRLVKEAIPRLGERDSDEEALRT
jgi:acyl carrier protein